MTTLDIILRLLLAISLGGIIGLEREASHKPAGLRTHILLCISAAMMMILSRSSCSRLVASAKSWLVHDQVDRRARILPWGAGKENRKVSPVEASAAYLMHIRNVWNRLRGEDEDLWLENQLVVLTVPASFDEVARELTLEAARQAGLPKVILLEEPVAVFYSWLNRHEKDWKKRVKRGELILVCDVAGGTTDFTLIILGESRGLLRFEPIAVGNHLILGGDNIDLALAAGIEKPSAAC